MSTTAKIFDDLTITSIDTINVFGATDDKYLFTIDEIQNATISQSEEKVDITGKQGRKLSSLKRNKAVTVSGTNGFISGGLLALQTGGNFESKSASIKCVETLVVGTDGTAKITYSAGGTAGAEIISLRVRNANGSLGDTLDQGSAVAAAVTTAGSEANAKFTYADKTLTFKGGTTESPIWAIAAGTEFVVEYNRTVTAAVLDNYSDKYSGKAKLYIDATAENKCSEIYHVQFFIPKADFSGEFSLEMGENQTVQAFEAEALAGGCGAGGKLWTYTVCGVES